MVGFEVGVQALQDDIYFRYLDASRGPCSHRIELIQ